MKPASLPGRAPRSRFRSGLGRAVLACGGVLLAVALAEGVLRVAEPLLTPPPKVPTVLSGWRVLCVGDSFVYGLGSEDDRGMCEYLQVLLDERWGPGVASVHNQGIPGINSSQAHDELVGWLEAVHPQVLVLLVGHNNSWNFNDLHLDQVVGGQGLGVARAMGRLRLVRLLRLVTRYDERQDRPLAEAEDDPELRAWSKTARKVTKEQWSGQEIQFLRDRLREHPGDVYSMLRLALALDGTGQPAEAVVWRQWAQEVDPQAVARLQADQKRIEAFHQERAGQGQDDHLVEHPSADAALYRAITLGGSEDGLVDQQRLILDAVLRSDLAQMAATAQQQGAAVLISGYPQPKGANEALEQTARELGLGYVDQQAGFAERLAGQDDLSPWFVLDGHCTSAGYRIMAENLLPWVLPLREGDGSN